MHPPASTTAPAAGGRAPAGNAYQSTAARIDRSMRCPNRNGVWPPLYKRHWDPHPARSQSNNAQAEWQRCVLDAVAAGELHRTTGAVLLVFSRASSSRLDDVWVAQATVAERLGLAAPTVCHHVAAAKRAGWVAVQHRNRIDHGVVLAMSNVTRLELPPQWATKLVEQRRQRAVERTAHRRQQPGRYTPRRQQPDRDARPATSPAAHAASAGAAVARSASTVTFDDGRRELADQFLGQPADLYEAAYESFVETWKTVRLNQ